MFISCANFMIFVQEFYMIRRCLPALSAEDARASICSFALEAGKSQELQDRLSQARSWYAVKNASGQWAFAPSKWAGYQKMTPSYYLDPHDGIDGRQTEKRLGEWFAFLELDSAPHVDLLRHLSIFLGKYGKQPSSACRIALIRGEHETKEATDDLVELIIRILDRLDRGQRNQIRRALKTYKAP
jgi:hypothetical protein